MTTTSSCNRSSTTATIGQHHYDGNNNKESSMTESRQDGSNGRVSIPSPIVTETTDSRSSLVIPESTSFDVDDATIVDSLTKMESNNLYHQDVGDDEEYIYKTPYCSHDYFYFLKIQPPSPYVKNFLKRPTRTIITWKDYEHRDDLPIMPSLSSTTLDDESNNISDDPAENGELRVVPFSTFMKMNVPLSLIDIENREEVEEDSQKEQPTATTIATTNTTEHINVNIPDLFSDCSKDSKKLLPKLLLSSTHPSPEGSELKAKDDTSSSFLKANASFKNTSRASFTSMDAIRAKGSTQDVSVGQIPPRRKTIHGARAA